MRRAIVALLLAASVACGEKGGEKKNEGDASTAGASGDRDAAMAGGGRDAASAGSGGSGGSSGSSGAGGAASGDCPAPAPNQPPTLLSCAGLYSDTFYKTLADDVHEFEPAVALWSDGADKTRWIYLPPGETIDVSDADSWRFPVGTKFFKEFRVGDKRVETRLFWKVRDTFWARTAYRWNDDETEAERTGGEDVEVDGSTYHIPSTTECDQCHKGRLDRVLGFETLLLGLPGATGMNLAELKDRDLLSGGTLPSDIEVGDDGTGHGTDALTWMHVNCGVSCHNGNSYSEAYSTGLKLLVKAADADGRASNDFDSRMTSLDVDATTGRWDDSVRIVPGSPDDSLLYRLMSTRNATNMKDQMPPIASRVVPEDAAELIRNWISEMNAN